MSSAAALVPARMASAKSKVTRVTSGASFAIGRSRMWEESIAFYQVGEAWDQGPIAAQPLSDLYSDA